jgi:hypothetical protein
LQDWESTLFSNKPLDCGLTEEECWAKLKDSNRDNFPAMPDHAPDYPSDFLFETSPILLPNQRAITLLAHTAAQKDNSWIYMNQPTGTGKSTMMLELGYLAALKNLD